VFRNSYRRRRKLSHNESHVKPDFVDALGDKWLEYEVYHHNVEEWKRLQRGEPGDIPDFFVTSNEIDWKRRVMIQSIIQRSVDHSISSTINLPKETDPAIVSKLYFEGWRRGLKGVTVYVDGSRSGVLVTDSAEEEVFPHHRAPKRPKELECRIHHTTIKGEQWTILVGLLYGKPYEVMGGLANYVEIPKKYTEGALIKHPRKTMNSVYDLRFGENGDEIVIKDIVKVFDNPNHSAFTRMISLGLRHGASVQYVVEQMQKDRDSDMFSFAKCVARVLKNYIKDGTMPDDKTCSSCSEESLVYVDGCVSCTACGYSKCS